MLRLAAALLVRAGLVFLILAALARLVPMPNKADVVVDDLAIAINLLLVLTAAIYLRLTRDKDPMSASTDPKPTNVQRISR